MSESYTINSGNDELNEKIREWIKWDENPQTKNEIISQLKNQKYGELRKCLMTRLSFGTAGIRGRMSAGYGGINDLVIVQTSQGLAKYLCQYDSNCYSNGIVMGFDGRHNSHRFARLASNAFLSLNIRVYLFSSIVPTPFVPFAIKTLGATAGVMITASHNPKDDNGYKVYFANGAQITAPHDKNIQNLIISNLKPWKDAWNYDVTSNNKLCSDPTQMVNEKYFHVIASRIYDKSVEPKLRITYTALHGVGHEFLTKAFKVCGLKNCFPVESQMNPDPEFPTVTFPNPEEGKGVLDESIKTATKTDSTLIIANDPDADRCAVAELQRDGQWRIFTGNEIGALLGWWLLYRYKLSHPSSLSNVYMISSAVSSKILMSMANYEGFNWVETLTGFKWMGNRSDELIRDGKTVLFAYEEAIGFMVGSTVLDKDGISAAVEVAQLAEYLRTSKSYSLSEHLKTIYRIYGYHYNLCSYYLCYDQNVINSIFQRLANFNGPNTYPSAIGPYQIVRVRDLNRGYDSSTPNNVPSLPSSSSSYMLTFYFSNGAVLTIRTSGTEPKIKYYSEAISSPENTDWSGVESLLHDLVNQMIDVCLEPQKNGLQPKHD